MPLPIRFSCAVAVLAAGWLSFCAMPPTALAEVVLLKSGAKVEGEILNPTRSKDDLVEVVPVEGLKLTLAASQVKGVLVQTKVLKDYEAAVARMADTLDAHLAMAQWCLEASLAEQRKFHLSQVIKHDPNHAMARATLGYIKVGSGWMTQNEYKRRQGYVLKGGAYRLAQELETTERAGQWERDTLAARKNLKMWFTWLNGKGKGIDLIQLFAAQIANMVLRKLLGIEHKRLNAADILFVFRGECHELNRGNGSADDAFGALSGAGENDVGDQIVTAARGAAAVEIFDAERLPIRVPLAGEEKLALLLRELLNDPLEFRFSWIRFGGSG